jgi:ADP-ribose pyrophosphatase
MWVISCSFARYTEKKKWGLPGGQQLEGESAWDTAIRECPEEIGLNIEPSLTGLYFLSHRNACVHVFKTERCSGAPVPDGAEVEEARFFFPWTGYRRPCPTLPSNGFGMRRGFRGRFS